jgi:hypothetical protein
MTKIQLRRDTAANWSTNNPTPSAGEPCFETDTGRLKIGDGITAYNSLPYQGGTSDTAVTTDTAQTISGEKTFTNDIVIYQWNNNISPVRETHIDLSNGSGNAFISANGTDKTFGMYTKNSEGIQLGTSSLDYTKGLSIKPSSLTFKNSDGTVTDLLAGGSGDIPVATDTTLGGVKIGSSVKLDSDNKLGINEETTLVNDIRNTNTATYNLGLGGYTTEKYSPLIKYDKDNHTVTARMTDRQTTNGFTSYDIPVDVTMMAKSFKVGDVTNQYDVVTKSPKNNEYMGHMAMPSNKFIDLELGASGTAYVAPADGYYRLTMKQAAAEQYAYLASYTDNDEPILSTTSKTATGTDSLSTWVLVHKGQKIKAVYNAPEKRVFRFIYAKGSEPAT